MYLFYLLTVFTRRRTKRDRNKTTVVSDRCYQTHAGKKNKSRSKSRSPGREIDRAIVIVHHTTCSHHRSRANSPDNLSESSISFHENEVISDISPSTVPRTSEGGGGYPAPPGGYPAPPVWYEGPVDPCVSVSRDPAPRPPGQYSNWESCRESWFSSGSDCCPRPSSGSDCPPQPPSAREKEPPRVPPHHPATLPRALPRGGAVLKGVGAMRQSSRESGSSSSRQSSRAGTRPTTRDNSHTEKLFF